MVHETHLRRQPPPAQPPPPPSNEPTKPYNRIRVSVRVGGHHGRSIVRLAVTKAQPQRHREEHRDLSSWARGDSQVPQNRISMSSPTPHDVFSLWFSPSPLCLCGSKCPGCLRNGAPTSQAEYLSLLRSSRHCCTTMKPFSRSRLTTPSSPTRCAEPTTTMASRSPESNSSICGIHA